MKTLGWTLTLLAFAFGAYLTALDELTVNWMLFMPVVIVGVIGAWMVKHSESTDAKDGAKLASSKQVLEESLNNIVVTLASLDGQKDKIPTYDMRFEIDAKLRDDLFAFADHRNAMKGLFGLKGYAEVMTHFAAGERYVNRVWSASTDGYVDEVLTYITKAHDQFEEAKSVFKNQ